VSVSVCVWSYTDAYLELDNMVYNVDALIITTVGFIVPSLLFLFEKDFYAHFWTVFFPVYSVDPWPVKHGRESMNQRVTSPRRPSALNSI
jgi:hypothetical protein